MVIEVIDSKEDRHLVTMNISNFLIYIRIDNKPGEEKNIMKIKEVLVDILVQTELEKHGPILVYKN